MDAGASRSAAHCTPVPHTHIYMQCHWVYVCAKSDICVWINLKLIESFCLDTLLDSFSSMFFYLPLWTPEICNARKSKTSARTVHERRHRALLLQNRRDRAPNKNWERSWKSRNRRAEIQNVFEINSNSSSKQQQQQRALLPHHVNVKRLQREPQHRTAHVWTARDMCSTVEQTNVCCAWTFLLIF